MSANTGVAPVSATELAVAAKVNDGTMTSSPGPMPAASRPRCSAAVPELTATQSPAVDQLGRTRPRRRRPRGPGDHAAAQHASTAARSSSPMRGLAGGNHSGLLMERSAGLARRERRSRGQRQTSVAVGWLERDSGRPTHRTNRAGTPATSAKSGTSCHHDRARGDHRPAADGDRRDAYRARADGGPVRDGDADRVPVARPS